MVAYSEEVELAHALEDVSLSDDDRVLRTQGLPSTKENGSRAVSALRNDDMNENESDINEMSIELNSININECGKTESIGLPDEVESISKQEGAEPSCTEACDDTKASIPTTSIPESQDLLSGDVNDSADAKNDEETKTIPTESSSSHLTDDNTKNDSDRALPGTKQESIQNSRPQQRVKLVYLTPAEVLSYRERIVQVQTSRGPCLFLPLKRNAPYTARTSSVHPATEDLIRLRNQLREENSNLQQILSFLRQTQGIRRSNIKKA